MRYFTKAQIEEIERRLATRSIRDSEFEEAGTVARSDFMAIVQNGVNKRLSMNALFDLILQMLEDSGAIDLSSYVTRSVDDLENYYLKSQTYTKNEVNDLVSRLHALVPADVLPTASENTLGKIYLIPSKKQSAENIRDEFITIYEENTYRWEQIGSTEVDLSGYSTTEEMNSAIDLALAIYKAEIDDDLATKQDVIADLSTIRSGASAGATAVQPAALNEKQDVIEDLSAIRSGAAAGSTSVQPVDIEDVAHFVDSGAIEPLVDPSDYATTTQLSQLSQKVDGIPSVEIDISEYQLTNGTIADGVFYNVGNYGTYHRCLLIPVSEYVGRKIKIVPGASAPYSQFIATILAQNVSNGTSVVFATGYSAVVTYTGTTELQIPDDGAYIYLYITDTRTTKDYTPDSVEIVATSGEFYARPEVDAIIGDLREDVGEKTLENVSAYKTGSITYIKEFSPHLITDEQTTIVAERNSGEAYQVVAVVERSGSVLYLGFTRVSENQFSFVAQAGDKVRSFYLSGGAVGDTFTLKYLQGTFSDIWESGVKIESIDNRVYRKSLNWIAIGDSLTDVQTLGAGVDNYVNLVAKTLGLNAINKGVSGTGYMNGQSLDRAFYQRIPNFTESADVITIFGSFNDLGAGDLGTAEDNDTTTVGGCMNATISALTTKYPDALIGIIAPTPWYESFDYGTYPQYRQYVQLLQNVAKRYSIPFLNLFEGSNLRSWEATFKANYFKNGDGVHPNTAGHRRFAGIIAEFIKGVIFPISTY